MRRRLLLALAFMAAVLVYTQVHSARLNAGPPAAAQAYPGDRVLTHREQAPLVRSWIEKRFRTLLPALMRREGIDMWIIVSREYDEDPVFRSMSPTTSFSSRRRTILVFFDRGGEREVERLSIGRFDYDKLFSVVPTANDEQWHGLRQVVEERNPKVIGINTSEAWNHADGLSANEKENLVRALGPSFAGRLKSAQMLAVGWLEVKLPEETEAFRHAMQVAHRIIAEAFSNKVITPGRTTTEDVQWWMRQRVAGMGMAVWFQPDVDIQREGQNAQQVAKTGNVIQPGDMLHCDFGIVYLGFNTDTQHLAYVLRPGETDAPAGLKAGLRAANRLQEITMAEAREGATGNQALAAALRQAREEGLTPSIYCHPVGYHGHAAGPPIGMTDYQHGVPVRGDYVFRPNTWTSIELNVTHKVPEWNGQAVRFAEEEDAVLLDGRWQWVDGNQIRFHLIKPSAGTMP